MNYYTPDLAGSGQFGICIKCKKPPTPEGHDGCLGTLPGDVMNACCGHGRDSQAYIQYWGGVDIRGKEAVDEQARLTGAAIAGNPHYIQWLRAQHTRDIARHGLILPRNMREKRDGYRRYREAGHASV